MVANALARNLEALGYQVVSNVASGEEAIAKALQELKLPRNRVKIESLSEEKKGLFGMAGAKPAKVRVSVIESK